MPNWTQIIILKIKPCTDDDERSDGWLILGLRATKSWRSFWFGGVDPYWCWSYYSHSWNPYGGTFYGMDPFSALIHVCMRSNIDLDPCANVHRKARFGSVGLSTGKINSRKARFWMLVCAAVTNIHCWSRQKIEMYPHWTTGREVFSSCCICVKGEERCNPVSKFTTTLGIVPLTLDSIDELCEYHICQEYQWNSHPGAIHLDRAGAIHLDRAGCRRPRTLRFI